MTSLRLLPLALLALAGCGAGDPTSDGEATPPDLAAGDAATAGCQPKCSGPAPHCNASRHCVACLDDAHCPSGTFCKTISDAASVCTPGCMSDDRCAAGQKCCASQCVDPLTDARNCGACGKS